MEEVSAPELCVDEVWSGAEGPPSIADLALEQKGIYYPLVQHHWLLTSLLYAAMTFKVKAKLLSLFDSKVRTDSHALVGSVYLCLFTASTTAPSSLRFELWMTKGLFFFSTKELKKNGIYRLVKNPGREDSLQSSFEVFVLTKGPN